MMTNRLHEDLQVLLENDDLHDLPLEARELARDLMARVVDRGFDVLGDLGSLPYRMRDPDGAGSSSPSGSRSVPWINIIPSSTQVPAVCAQMVLAIASRPLPGESAAQAAQRGRLGLAMILRLLRENLVHCGCGASAIFGRTALVLTDHWDRRRAYESRLDLDAHGHVGNLRSALLHWDGRRWRRQWL